MTQMKVYRISFEDFGPNPVFNPHIPQNMMGGEDKITPRICVCPTITGCVDSLNLTFGLAMNEESNDMLNIKKAEIPLYLYEAIVDVGSLYQPTLYDVPDVWRTGELWLLESWRFVKVSNLILRKHMELPNSAYSRYCLRYDSEDEIIDVVAAGHAVYGDHDCFSFIGFDYSRVEQATAYWEDNMV